VVYIRKKVLEIVAMKLYYEIRQKSGFCVKKKMGSGVCVILIDHGCGSIGMKVYW
jgi:hypothetical protein